MYTASMVLIAAFLLMLAEGKLVESAWLRHKLGKQTCLKIDRIAGGLLRAAMGGACVALNIGAWIAGEYRGTRTGIVTRADHPFWFWTIVAIFLPSSVAVLGWGLSEFVQGLKTPMAVAAIPDGVRTTISHQLSTLLRQAADEVQLRGDGAILSMFEDHHQFAQFLRRAAAEIEQGNLQSLDRLASAFTPTSDIDDARGNVSTGRAIYDLIQRAKS